MAADTFSRSNESPLASPWGAWGSLGTCRLLSNAVQNSSGSDTDSGCLYTSSNVADSLWIYTSGTTDGGPAIHCAAGPDGYLMTAYNGSEIFIFRLDDGGFTELGHVTGVYTAGQSLRVRRSSNNVIGSKNGSDIQTYADTTYTGTSGNPGGFFYAGNLIMDGWTDGVAGGYTLAMDQGSYALTGQATGIKADRRITAAQGSYALTGQAVGLKYGHMIAAVQGSYTLSGQAVTLTGPEVSYSLSAEQGSYTLTGSDAAVDLEVNIDSGSYTLTGNAVGLAYGHKVAAAQGAYALNGQALTIRLTRVMSAAAGSYALTGQDVGLTSHDPSPVLLAETGIYALSGQQVALIGPDGTGEIFRFLPLNWWTK